MGSSSKQNQVPIEVGDDYSSAMVLSFSSIFPALLNAAIDLNLFEIIAKGECSSMSASEIASKLPKQHPDLANRLERMLPSLASYSLLNCSIRTTKDGMRERVYALSPIGKYFARDQDGGSLCPFTSFNHRGFNDLGLNAKDAILDASNNNHFQNVYGMPIYQYLGINKELAQVFDQAMAQSGPLEIKRILKVYEGFEGLSTLVDVGGGVGQALRHVVSKYPSIKGINFDLPHVIQDAPPHPGVEHVGGDMFESVPLGDAIMLKVVCHNWSDEDCIKFLRNCHKALPQHGKVIIMDYIMPEVPNSSNISKITCIMDYLMFLGNGGKERTIKEYERLCKSSGFSRLHVACNDFYKSGVIEFHK